MVAGLVTGRAIWRPSDRWEYIHGPQGLVYRADRYTGQTYMTWPNRREWLPVSDPPPRYSDLPPGAKVEIPPLPPGYTLEN